jgi:AraC-like DNA-binding protein/quercetin dioxygenase-like cupin family protein
MGYYCFITDDSFSEGHFSSSDLDRSRRDRSFSKSSLSVYGGVYQTLAPFQIILMSVDPSAQIQTRATTMSPGDYMYAEFEKASFELHRHNTFELVYVREGTLYHRIENERHVYPTGSVLLLNRNVRHSEEATSAFCTVSLSLSAEYFQALLLEDRDQVFKAGRLWGDNTELQEFLSAELLGTGKVGKNYLDFIPLRQPEPEEDSVWELFEQMTMIMLSPKPGDVFTFRALICKLLNLLCRRELFTTRPISLGTESESRIFSEISKLMRESDGRISRELLVEKLRYSGSYLNRIVQTFTGMNITQYALSYALERAAWLLVNTDITITEIVAELGFSNRSYFYTEFQKHYELTPRAYRLQNRKK